MSAASFTWQKHPQQTPARAERGRSLHVWVIFAKVWFMCMHTSTAVPFVWHLSSWQESVDRFPNQTKNAPRTYFLGHHHHCSTGQEHNTWCPTWCRKIPNKNLSAIAGTLTLCTEPGSRVNNATAPKRRPQVASGNVKRTLQLHTTKAEC